MKYTKIYFSLNLENFIYFLKHSDKTIIKDKRRSDFNIYDEIKVST